MNKALFIFRRDLRLEDNTGLLFACKHAKEVILCFIFTPEQIENNPYRGDRSVQFMIESLEDLEKKIEAKKGKLYTFCGDIEKVVASCIETLGVDGVVVNRDYTPYSTKRDQKIQKVCDKFGASFFSLEDALLHPMEDTLKSDGNPYTVFTPYFKNASRLEVEKPARSVFSPFFAKKIPFAKDSQQVYQAICPARYNQQKGGRDEGIKILKKIEQFDAYSTLRDYPAEEGTTRLSPHLKFTTVSPREVYYAMKEKLGPRSDLIRSLYWRDFFTQIAFYFPHVFQGAFKQKYDHIEWSEDKNRFRLWCEGKTGFPLVDAGMRELNQTGFMHNRVRMVTASFLVKDLHIDWRLGEKYFAKHLIDYDPAVNNGNWQWVASTGCDAQPYFRIFNPWSQSAKFDPDCVYIKKWIGELAACPSKGVHTWYLGKYFDLCPLYPKPILDHTKEAKKAISAYK